MDVYSFWDAVLRQDAARMRTFFTDSARISWPCTAENFTAEEFIRANCAYPGAWTGTVERVEQAGDTMISVSRVCAAEGRTLLPLSIQVHHAVCDGFHVARFLDALQTRISAFQPRGAGDASPPAGR